MSKYKKLSFKNVKTYSLKSRESKVSLDAFAKNLDSNPSFSDFFDSLPDILTGRDFKNFIRAYIQAINSKSQVILMMGAHVIKVGLSMVLIDVLKKGWITHLAMNGAGAIHDVELALCGKTSEDVASGLEDGSFGMVEETNNFINDALSKGSGKFGYAEAIAKAIQDTSAMYKEYYKVLKQNPNFCIKQETSNELKSVNDLISNEFLVVSEDYVNWARECTQRPSTPGDELARKGF